MHQLSLNLFNEDNSTTATEVLFTSKRLPKSLRKILESTKIKKVGSSYNLFVPTTSKYALFKPLLPLFKARWSKKEKTHICSINPESIINLILEEGLMPDVNPYDFYPTSKEIVIDEMLPALGLKQYDLYGSPYFNFESSEGEGLKFLDPSAGDGAILKALIEIYPKAKFYAFEIENNRRQFLENHSKIEVLGSDFLNTPINQKFDFIAMNPPFRDAIRGNPNIWMKHIKKAFSLVSRIGVLASIVPETLFISEQKEILYFKNWMLSFGEAWKLPKDAFKDSGTGIQTSIISLKKADAEEVYKMWEECNGYPSRYCYYLCLGLDNDKVVHDSLVDLEKLKNRQFTVLYPEIKKIVQDFIAREERRDTHYFCDSRVMHQAVKKLYKHLQEE